MITSTSGCPVASHDERRVGVSGWTTALAVLVMAVSAGCGGHASDASVAGLSDTAAESALRSSGSCTNKKNCPPPTVTITAPTAGATVSGTVSITGTASGSATLSSVAVSIDGGAYATASGLATWSYSLSTSTLANGVHAAQALVTDSKGNTGSASVSFNVSNVATAPANTPPTIAINAPAAGATVSATVTISGTASDNSAVTSVTVKIDGAAYQAATGTASWSYTLDTTALANGSHTITARATDDAGAYTETAETVNVSNAAPNTPPSVAITSPAAGATVSGTVTVAGSATDNSRVASVAVKVDSGALHAATGTASWSYTLDTTALANGSHTITARATDDAGAYTETAETVNVSNTLAPPPNTPPTIAISSPVSGTTISGAIAVAGTASDNSKVASVSVKIDSGSYHAATGTTSWSYGLDTTALANGSHTITARATDDAGAYTETSSSVNVSNVAPNTPPTVSITSPGAGATVSGAITISGTASDTSAVASVTVKIDSGSYQAATGTTSWSYGLNTATLANGSHTVTARATDDAGAYTETSETINVSNASSGSVAVSISSPSNGATVSGMVTVTGTASGAVRVQVLFDAMGYIDVAPAANWSYVFDSTALANGGHTLTARVTSSTGATSSTQIGLNVSNTNVPPVVTIVTPAAGATVSGLFQVSGFAYDDNGIGAAQISIDGGTPVYASGFGRYARDIDTSSLANGTHTLTITAPDDLGATGTAASTFIVSNKETVPPTITVSSPAGGSTVSGTITISGTASDNDGLARVDFRENYLTYKPATGTYSWSYSLDTRGLANGTHTFFARAVDLTGNVATTTFTLNVANGTSNESLVTPEGVHISVNTASGFSAAAIYNVLKQNSAQLSLLGPTLTVVVNDTEPADAATTSCSGSSCTFRIGLNVAPGSSCANNPADVMAHEYGHIWSNYHVTVNNGGAWGPYLHARGLDSDPRINSNYDMSIAEIAADDHKILYGSPDAGQSYSHRLIKHPSFDPSLLSWFNTYWK